MVSLSQKIILHNTKYAPAIMRNATMLHGEFFEKLLRVIQRKSLFWQPVRFSKWFSGIVIFPIRLQKKKKKKKRTRKVALKK
jgi:GT2 family glycosyltransferase